VKSQQHNFVNLLDCILICPRTIALYSTTHICIEYLPQNGVIVDLGCGYGLISNLLAFELERLVIGVELSAPRIAAALQSIKDRRNIEFYAADIA